MATKTNTTARALPTPEQWAETIAREEALQAQLALRDAELDKIRTYQETGLVLKISQWGALQINGLRQGYVGFYRDEWTKILSMAERIQEFLDEHPLKRDEKGEVIQGAGVLEKGESYAIYPADMRNKK
jgi:hypothetical protein